MASRKHNTEGKGYPVMNQSGGVVIPLVTCTCTSSCAVEPGVKRQPCGQISDPFVAFFTFLEQKTRVGYKWSLYSRTWAVSNIR